MTKDREPIEGEWRGEEKWSCPFCAFDSLQRDRVTFHIEQVHPLPPVKETFLIHQIWVEKESGEEPKAADLLKPKPATVTKGAKS